jgi:electron transfer flavoprotein beta subunit
VNVVVCVKQTPDTAATLSVKDGVASWGDAPLVLNPWDEYAVEQALRTKEAHGGKVTALSVGPPEAREALKQSLAMGCDEAVLITDSALSAADSLVTSAALAAALRKIGDVDIAFFGKQAVDTDTGVTAAQVARRLGWPSLTLTAAIPALDPSQRSITVERMMEESRQTVRASLPAVVSVVKEINEPRYPSFMGIRRASKAEIPVWSASDIGLTPVPGAVLSWPEMIAPPKVAVSCEFIEGATPQETAAQLVSKLLEAKVL